VARTRAALALIAVIAAAAASISGGSPADPRTPPALPGRPPPFMTAAVLGDGGLTAGVDAYGDIVDLRAGSAGRPLIDNPVEAQVAGSVPGRTGIVPLASVRGGPALPLWQADSVRQRYLPGTNVLRTVARFGAARVAIECAARGGELGCASGSAPGGPPVEIAFRRDLLGGGSLVHLDDARAPLIVTAATAAGRRWLAAARPLEAGAPAWVRRLYSRSLLVIRALADRSSGAVAAGARDGWAYVWPRDASAVAIALASAGYRAQARRVARFLLGLDLDAAARYDGAGDPVEGRAAQGDAAGWTAAAAAAAGIPADVAPLPWRNRPDYQEKSSGTYLANALATAGGPKSQVGADESAHRPVFGGFVTTRGLARTVGDSPSGLDSAAAWAVRPFARPELFAAARRTLLRLLVEGGRFGIVPSEDWREADPWTAPTAWSAWSLAALAAGGRGAAMAANDRRAALWLLHDLRRAATPAGLLPERVDARTGVPRSTTPLAWTHAFAVLALRQLWPGRAAGHGHAYPGAR